MTTKREPIHRPPQWEITAEAVRLFRRMQATRCTCAPRAWGGDYWRHKACVGCGQWWELNSLLHDELKLPPHFWPSVEHPESRCPFPHGSPAARAWQPGEHRRQMYRDLEAANRAARRRAGPRDPG